MVEEASFAAALQTRPLDHTEAVASAHQRGPHQWNSTASRATSGGRRAGGIAMWGRADNGSYGCVEVYLAHLASV